MNFLSERNIELHKLYLNDLSLKYSIFEKSYSELKSASLSAISKVRIKREEREAAYMLKAEIMAHKLFFSSFQIENLRSPILCCQFGSEAQFMYEMSNACQRCEGGFLLIYREGDKIKSFCGREYQKIMETKKPALCLDLCEHAYFYDYGFDKKSYILNALRNFDYSKL